MSDSKRQLGNLALEFVEDNYLIGLGSGSTATEFIKALANIYQLGKWNGMCIASSLASYKVAKELKLPLVKRLQEGMSIDLLIDGADYIDPEKNMIKGYGGALLREKLLANCAKQYVIIAESSKCCGTLIPYRVPVEIVPFSLQYVLERLYGLGIGAKLRKSNARTYVTDNHNFILDLTLKQSALEDETLAVIQQVLKKICGVVETGLFLNYCPSLLIEDEGKVAKR